MEGYMAQILWFAADFAPKNWMLCQGQQLAIASNQALFSLIGTMYGGDGITNFKLPDFQGRVPVGAGAGKGLSPYNVGQKGGTETTTMTVNQMPPHSHTVSAKIAVGNVTGASDEPDGNTFANAATNNFASATQANGILAGASLNDAVTGASQPFPLLQPTLCVNFVICVYGIFPSRS